MTDFRTLEAFGRLKSLRQNVPNKDVETKYVDEFHQVLDLLESVAGVDLKNFRIPASEVRPVVVGGNYVTGETYYSSRPFCDHAFFLMKLDAVLTMFELLIQARSSDKPAIGFTPPTR